MRLSRTGVLLALAVSSACLAPAVFTVAPLDQEKATRTYVGKEYVLGSSVYFTDFFGDKERLFVDARPFEIIELYHSKGEKVAIGVPSETIIPAGTPVKVKELVYPADPLMVPFEDRSELAPTGHPWLVVERTGEGASPLPLVFVLPREMSELKDLQEAITDNLKSQQWVTTWLTQRDPALLDAIYRKEPTVGMTWAGLKAALGEPRNVREKDPLLPFVADYGDLQVSIKGDVVAEVVSLKAQAEEAQRKALEEAEKARIEAEKKAKEEAEREAKEKEEAEEARKKREEQAAVEREAVEAAAAEARAQEEAERKAEREAAIATAAAERERKRDEEMASAREAELAARLAAAKAAKEKAEREREQAVREAELARKVAEAESAALAAKRKAEEDAARAQADAVQARRKLQSQLKKAERDAATAEREARKAEAKAAGARREIDGAQKRVDALHAKAREGRKIGAKLQTVSPQVAGALGMKSAHGAFVAEVKKGSPAARAGMQPNDIIVRAGGDEVRDPSAFVERLDAAGAQPIAVELLRSGKTVKVTVDSDLAGQLAKEEKALARAQQRGRPALEAAARARADADAKARALAGIKGELAGLAPASERKIGVKIEAVSPQLSAALGLGARPGAFVAAVKRGGEASRGGLEANDIVVAVNGIAVGGPGEFKDLVAKSLEFETIDMTVLRKGKKTTVKVPPSSDGSGTAKAKAPPPPRKPRRAPPDPRKTDLSTTVDSATSGRGPVKPKN